MIYLDNAATSWPKPETVYQTLDNFIREKGGNPGHGSHSLAMSAKQTIEETRTLVASFINASFRDRVVFTLNCTESINLGLKGMLKPGDHVIVSGLEHNAVMRPLWKLAQKGVKFTIVPVSPATGVTSPADIEAAITPWTRMIVTVHASNVNGSIQPIAEYGQIARKHNITFLVDAAQSAGHIPIDVQAENIDLLAISAHKGTLGPPGVGVLYIGPRVSPDPLLEGGTGSESESESQPEVLPDKYESGTLNSLGISGLGAGLKYILQEGPEKIHGHESALTQALMAGLKTIPGVKLFTARNGMPQAPVVSFTVDGYQPAEVGVILDQHFDIKARTGLHCAPEAHRSLGTLNGGTIRLSPGYFNTREQIEKTITAIRQIAASRLK